MKRLVIGGTILLIIGIVFRFCFYTNQDLNKKNANEIHSEIFSTPDEFYFNDVCYLINQSPLSFFTGYKKFYPMAEVVEINTLYGTCGNPINTNYYVQWLLADSTLYLRNICFYTTNDKLSKEEQCSIMEKETGRKFIIDRNSLALQKPQSSIKGSMLADWVTGEFYIKRVRRISKEDAETIDQWEQLPFQKLIFKNGKLISEESVVF